jgi:PAS domain S-box-containing protein
MAKKDQPVKQLLEENQGLRARLEELEDTLRAIQSGEVDALVVSGQQGEQIYTLKDANQPYRVLVETMNEGTATVAPDGIVLYSNTRLAAMLKMPLEQVIGTSMRLHVTDGDRSIFDNLLKNSLRTTCQGELSLKAGDGTLPVQLSFSAVRSEGMDCAVMVLTDLTVQKKAEEALRRASENLEVQVRERTAQLARSNADLQQFAYIASHDLKEPLRTIGSFVRLLEKRYKDSLDEKAHEYIKHSIDGVKRMESLITDLLEYSKVGTEDREFQAAECSLILSKTISNLSAAIEESGAVVAYDELPTVMGHPAQLSSLFQNLIGNAIKYRSKETPQIHISAERKKNEWIFSVRDNGIGIDPRFTDRIFAVFQRLQTVGECPGTGIGLAICKKIVELHGGNIWVESDPGNGSTFFFTLPALEVP